MTWHDAPLWVLAAFCLHALFTNLAWLCGPDNGTGPCGRSWRALQRFATPPFARSLRAAYLLGIPVAAVATRVVTPEAMGLVAPRSLGSTVQSIGLGCLAFVVLLAGWWWLPRPLRPTQWSGGKLSWDRATAIALEAALREVHWAFLRAAALAVASAAPVAAVSASVALAGAEAISDPRRRESMSEPLLAATWGLPAAAAVVSAYTFLTTGSSVLAWAIHLVLALGLARALSKQHAGASSGIRRPVVAAPPVGPNPK